VSHGPEPHLLAKCRHVSRGPGPRLLAELSSGAATCSSALDLTSLPRWAPTLPCVPWIRARPPREETSGVATCSSAPDLASLLRWAPALPHGPDLASLRGELRCYHIPHGPQRPVDHRNKERPSCPWHVAGLACVQSTGACYRGACNACGHAATVHFNSTTQAQLTTPGHGYSDDTTRQDDTTALTMFSVTG
jgi:hypothetical protein